MKHKTNIILFGFLLLFGTPAFAQNPTSLQGSVVSETGEKIEFYTLVLQSAVDSSIVAVEMFSETVFRFSGIKPETYILRLQDVRYQPYDTLITVVEGANELKTPLTLKPKTLGEVVVKSSRPVLSYNHGNITVDVANSYLKDDINLESILGKLPGVIVDDKGGISMFGKKNLLIYINGMQARSDDELKSLQPDNIDKIEIIRNVGSEYEANVDAVIKIKTKKRREEKYHISINDVLQISHYICNTVPSLSLYLGSNEKLSQYITLSSRFGELKERHKSYIYTYLDDYTYSNFRNDYDVDKSRRIGLFYSLNYSISKDRELGFQYSGGFNDFSNLTDGTRFYDDETISRTVDLYSEEQGKTNSSTVNLNYKQKVNNTGELSVVADYMIRNNNTITDIKESATDWNANNIIDSDDKGKVFSITPEYKIDGMKFKYNTGLKYSQLNSKSTTEFRPSTNVDNTRLSEYTTGAYMVFDADLSFLNIKSGVRAEYTNSDIRSDDGSNDLHRNYFNLVPNISIDSKPNKHLNLSTYYSRRLRRPSISALSSTVKYWDSLTYLSGNPHLRPEITDVFGFNAVFYKFDFLIEYNIYRDEIIFENIPDSENPNRTINTFINQKEKYNTLDFGISYSFNHPVFTNMTSLKYSKQFNLSMPFLDEIIRFDKPRYYFQTSGNVKILKNTSLNYSFSYRSVGHSGTLRFNKPSSNLLLAASQYMMNKKLLISLSFSDIFNKNKGNRWTQYHNGNIIYTQDSDALYSRNVVFRIRYNWGKSKSIQKKTSDTDHIGRL
jgi:hypothetical protein